VEIEAYNIKAMDGLDVLFIYRVLFLTVVTETTAVMCGAWSYWTCSCHKQIRMMFVIPRVLAVEYCSCFGS
jgi:hypothetical protein